MTIYQMVPQRKRVKLIMKETFTRRQDWMIEQPSVEEMLEKLPNLSSTNM